MRSPDKVSYEEKKHREAGPKSSNLILALLAAIAASQQLRPQGRFKFKQGGIIRRKKMVCKKYMEDRLNGRDNVCRDTATVLLSSLWCGLRLAERKRESESREERAMSSTFFHSRLI